MAVIVGERWLTVVLKLVEYITLTIAGITLAHIMVKTVMITSAGGFVFISSVIDKCPAYAVCRRALFPSQLPPR